MFNDSSLLAQLLRTAGPRLEAPEDRSARVKSAVQAEWQALVLRQRSRRRAAWAGGGLAVAALVILLFQVQARPGLNPQTSGQSRALGTRGSMRTETTDAPAQDVRFVQDPFAHRREGGRYLRGDSDNVADDALSRAVVVSYSWESR